MIAIIEIGGHQYTVKKGDIIEVDRIDERPKAKIEVQPLLVSDEKGVETKVGTPVVEDAKVTLTVVEEIQGDKVTVFKMKAKKRYARKTGFRAKKTVLKVASIA